MQITLPTQAENKLFKNLFTQISDVAKIMSNAMHTYWLADYIPNTEKVYIDMEGQVFTEQFDAQTVGVRPMIPASEVQKLNVFGKKTFTYGEFPQKLVSDRNLRDKLNELSYEQQLKRTGKEYTFPFRYHKSKCGEFEYQGKKYVNISDIGFWFEVTPIEWVRDNASGPAISKNVLFTSMWNDYAPNDSRFNPNHIGLEIFLRDVFAKEIEKTNTQIQVQQLFPAQNTNSGQNVTHVINQALSPDEIADVQFTIPNDDVLFHSDYMDVVNCDNTDVAAISNGCFWIDSLSIPKPQPRMVKAYKSTVYSADRDTFYGVRPMISGKESQKIRHLLKKVGETRLRKKNIYEFGEFPQDKVDASEARMLEFNASLMRPTGKTYHSDYRSSGQTFELKEYAFNKNKYARSGDKFYHVKPIRWIEGPDGCLMAENILLTSVWGNGADPDVIINGLNTRFAKEIEETNTQIQVQQLFPNQNTNGGQDVNNVINQALSPQNYSELKFRIPNDEDMYNSDYIEVLDSNYKDFGRVDDYDSYWIDSPYIMKQTPRIIKNGTVYTATVTFFGVRPMLSAAEVQKIRPFLREVGETPRCKLKIYEFGEFPQTKVDDTLFNESSLQTLALHSESLSLTGKKYHRQYSDAQHFEEAPEYVCKGEKYAYSFSDGKFYKVEPIRWVEGKDGSLLSESILLSSLWGKGDNPDIILNGLNDLFAKEIIPQGNTMQNSNSYPRIINEHELGDGITVSDMTIDSDSGLPDVQGENNGWFQPSSNSQTPPVGASSSQSGQIPANGGQPFTSAVDDYDESVNATEEITPQTQKGNKTMNSNSQNSTVVVDETPMSVNEQIEFYVKNGLSFMLHGPSGIGKTARVEQIDPDLTAVPLWNGVLPEDIVGKVRYPSGQEIAATEENGNNGVWVEPDWYVELKRKCEAEPEKMHVLFIDEVTNARPTTQSLIFHLTLKKSITPSKGKLPENSVVVLAGNNRNESEAAYNMPEPLFRRMSGHIYLEPNVREWMVWGSESSYKHPNEKDRTNIHPLVTSFVGTYGDDVFYSEYNEEESKYALDPRGWEQISDIIYDNHGVIRKELLVAKMGHELAANFLAFARIPQLSVEDVVNHNYDGRNLPRTQDARLALTLNLRHADAKQQKEVRRFIAENLGKEYCSVFDAARASSELSAKNKGMAFKLGGWGRNG